MRNSKRYIWSTLLILFLSTYSMTGQEITIHNLPKDYDFSSLEPQVWDKGGDNKIYLPVVFAKIRNEYIFLTDQQILDFNKEWIDFISLVKSSDLLTEINYNGPYRVVVYNIEESNKEELFNYILKE